MEYIVIIMGFDLCCIGDINIDIITSPLGKIPKIEEQEVINDLKIFVGGSSAICAAAGAGLGLRTCFQGLVGNDYFGRLLVKKMKGFGVVPKIRMKNNVRTGATIALNFDSGKRSFISCLENNRELCYSHLDMEVLKNCRHLHISGIWHTRKLLEKIPLILKKACSNGATTSLDIGGTLKSGRWNYLRKILGNINILFLNKKELDFLRIPVNKLRKKVDIVALHLGEKGTRIHTEDETIIQKAIKVKVVNPVGSGDVYNAAFIYCFLDNKSLEECARAAVKAPAIYIQKEKQLFPKRVSY